MATTGKRILLSTFACDPYQGSEPGVGWNWALELARMGHEVWVLTRTSYRSSIQRVLEDSPLPLLKVIYFDFPFPERWKNGSVRYRIHYWLWQIGAYFVARTLSRKVVFDFVHHLTLGSIRYLSFLPFLGLPFVIGPVGGGEVTPRALRKGYPIQGRFGDFVRDLSNAFVRMDPLAHAVFRRATLILCKNQESLQALPAPYRSKGRITLEIGAPQDIAVRMPENNAFRALYVGRLLYLKGVHLALKAFARLHAARPDAKLTLIGSGREERWLKQLAMQLGIEDALEWIPWLEKSAVMETYPAHDVFLFPSLQDSSGNVVLEALCSGLPVISLDIGGPAVMVEESCGRVIETRGVDEEAVVSRLADALLELYQDPQLRNALRQGALERARQFSWESGVRRAYAWIDEAMAGKSIAEAFS